MVRRQRFLRFAAIKAEAGDAPAAVDLMAEGMEYYSRNILDAISPYDDEDAGMIISALRGIADQMEDCIDGAKELAEAISGMVPQDLQKERGEAFSGNAEARRRAGNLHVYRRNLSDRSDEGTGTGETGEKSEGTDHQQGCDGPAPERKVGRVHGRVLPFVQDDEKTAASGKDEQKEARTEEECKKVRGNAE